MSSGIYIITNTCNGKVYIGSAVDLDKRWRVHLHCLRKGVHWNISLQRSWNKNGESSFEFTVVEYCTKEMLLKREQHWLNLYEDGDLYNINPTAGSNLGRKWSSESRAKMSKAGKEKWQDVEYREKMSKVSKKRWQDPNHRDKMTKIKKKLWLNPDYRESILEKLRISNINRGGLKSKKIIQREQAAISPESCEIRDRINRKYFASV